MSKVILFSGPPLSGKSTLASSYACEVGVPVFEMDSIRLRILPDSNQSKEDRNIAYRCMHYTTERLILCEVKEIVLVATYRRWDVRRELAETIVRTGARLYVLQCAVDAESAVKRFSMRPLGHAAVDLNLESVRHQSVEYPYYPAAPVINTTQMSIADTLSAVMKHINSGGPLQNIDQWIDQAK